MQNIEWPQPPICLEDVSLIFQLLTEEDLARLLRRVGWLRGERMSKVGSATPLHPPRRNGACVSGIAVG